MCLFSLLPLDPVCGTSSDVAAGRRCALIQIYGAVRGPRTAPGGTPARSAPVSRFLGIHARGACSTIRPIVAALAVL